MISFVGDVDLKLDIPEGRPTGDRPVESLPERGTISAAVPDSLKVRSTVS